MLDCLTPPHHRDAYLRVITTNGQAAVDYELRLLAEGGERPGVGAVPAAGWARVGEALHQMAVAGSRFTSKGLQGFLARVTPDVEASASAAALDFADVVLALARQFDLFTYRGNAQEYAARVANALATPDAEAVGLDRATVYALKLADGVANQEARFVDRAVRQRVTDLLTRRAAA